MLLYIPVFSCSRVPRYVLVENVKGFEKSAMRDDLIRVLTSLDFQYQVHTYCIVVCDSCASGFTTVIDCNV